MTQTTGPEHETSGFDRYMLHEVGQVVRALEANGPCTEEQLGVLVGAPYWETNRFRRVLTFMKSDRLLAQDASGSLRLTR
jgi:hypothetical protein